MRNPMNRYEKVKEIVKAYTEKANSDVFEDYLIETYLRLTEEEINEIYVKLKQGSSNA